MSTSTTNEGLVKPDGGDLYDISVLNANLDKLDAKVSELRELIKAASSIKDGSITGSKIAENTISTSKYGGGSVDENALADRSVTSPKIAEDAVTGEKIAFDAITADHLAQNSVTSDSIMDGSVGKAELASDSVDADKIASKAVGTDELADSAVTSLKLAKDAVTAEKLAGLIPQSKMAVKVSFGILLFENVPAFTASPNYQQLNILASDHGMTKIQSVVCCTNTANMQVILPSGGSGLSTVPVRALKFPTGGSNSCYVWYIVIGN